ncbi:ABC transporter ATP-binding protein [Actinomadura sp. 1N219]|uniref:ABC transporter ATP-binding protein n=1 Tax=Actinomadura sp. 1N219 TaxID=3375152 RepID=UPI0037AD9389
MSELLRAEALSRSFGGLRAVHEVSLHVRPGEIVGLIGPNGAGKSTIVDLLAGGTAPDSGAVRLLGEDVTGLPPHERARRGLIRTFQQSGTFPMLGGRDVMMAGLSARSTDSFASWLLTPWRARRRRQETAGRAADLLRAVDLEGTPVTTPVGLLPPGVNRMLGFSVAMAGDPKALVLDEPCAGLAPSARSVLSERIREIADSGVGVLLIEHDVAFIMRTCARVVALDHGEVIAEGGPDEVRADPAVRRAYLGTTDLGATDAAS